MTFPALIFSLMVAVLYACVFHLFRGGNLFTLFIYILFSVAGFMGGDYLARLLGIDFLRIGTIHFGIGSAFSIGLLMISGWVSRPIQ